MSIEKLFIFNWTRRNSWNSRNYNCDRSDIADAYCSRDTYTAVYKMHYCILLCVLKFTISITTWRWKFDAENFCMSRAMHAIPFCLYSGCISRRPADTLICKRVNRGPVCLVHAVNCELAALSSVLNSLLNDYINGSDIPSEVECIARN